MADPHEIRGYFPPFARTQKVPDQYEVEPELDSTDNHSKAPIVHLSMDVLDLIKELFPNGVISFLTPDCETRLKRFDDATARSQPK